MLACRALLTAVTVTCTLSPVPARTTTMRLDRIKDLMCVLLLSGLQKEDLDVRMLNKLERHNVNIHDMNNEDLLKECITNRSINNNVITTVLPVQETNSRFQEHSPPIVSMNTNIYQNRENIQKEQNNKDKEVIQYIDGQPELQSVLKFWQEFKMSKSTTELPSSTIYANVEIPDENLRYDQKNKRNSPDPSNSYEADMIKMLLANLFTKRENKDILQTTERTISMNELYKDILERDNNQKSMRFYENYKTETTPFDTKKLQLKITKEDKWKFNIENAIKTLKTYYVSGNDQHMKNLIQTNKLIKASSKKFDSNKIFYPITSSTTENVKDRGFEQKIPQNMIQEIAKNVKELVLRDLRNDMLQITTKSYLTTKTSRIVTTMNKPKIDGETNKGKEPIEQSILNKFMELFEEIKTLKRKTVIISSEITKTNKVANEESNVQTYPMMPKISEIELPITTYGVDHYANYKIQKTFDFSPQIHKFRSKGVSKSNRQISIKSTQPITFQTNNMEIPPLGIPVDRPENPINQNIIVPTLTPYRIGDYKFDLNQIKLTNPRVRTDDAQKFAKIPVVKTPEEIYHISNEHVQRFPLHNNALSDYNHVQYEPNNRVKVKNPVIPRFHEKLERNIDYIDVPEHNNEHKDYAERDMDRDCCNEKFAFSKQMVDCCNHKIASRQQMSLHAMKKQSYDDTHFKNFLKSQQKVTDMLERVLASRGRVRSVETA